MGVELSDKKKHTQWSPRNQGDWRDTSIDDSNKQLSSPTHSQPIFVF